MVAMPTQDAAIPTVVRNVRDPVTAAHRDFAIVFGCPMPIAIVAINNPTPLLTAVRKIGPQRVRWNAEQTQGRYRWWVLDGKPAVEADIIRAAGAIRTPRGDAISAGRRGELSPTRARIVELMNGPQALGLSYRSIAEVVGAPVGTVAGAIAVLRQRGLIPWSNAR